LLQPPKPLIESQVEDRPQFVFPEILEEKQLIISEKKTEVIPQLTFKVKCSTKWGQEVFISGGHSAIGSWDITKAAKLNYIADLWWECSPIIFNGEFEYKYLIKAESSKEITWEDGRNRISPRSDGDLVVVETFNVLEDRNCLLESEPFVSVMSFNIRVDVQTDNHKWHDRKFVISTIINNKSPDLIGLQEPEHHQLQDLLNLNSEYSHIGIGRSGGQSGEYSAILYKKTRFDVDVSGTFWLSSTPDRPSQDWGAACLRICSWAKFTDKKNKNPASASFIMYNTHLDHVSAHARYEGMKLILEKLQQHKNLPVILTGDLNASPSDQLISYIKSSLKSTSDEAAEKVNEHVGTLTMWEPRDNNETIDYIFVNEHFESRMYEVITEYDVQQNTLASDHRPIVARLMWKQS